MDNFNPYDVLGVSKNFTLEELKYNYKKVAKRVHPDRGGNEKLFKLLSKHQLKDKEKMKYCDFIVVNNKSLNVLKKKLLNIIKLYD